MSGFCSGAAKAELEAFLAGWAGRHYGIASNTYTGCVRFDICIDNKNKPEQITMLNELFAGLESQFGEASFACTISLPSCSILATKKPAEAAFRLTRISAADQPAITAVRVSSQPGMLDLEGYNLGGDVTVFKCVQGEVPVEYLAQSSGEKMHDTVMHAYLNFLISP